MGCGWGRERECTNRHDMRRERIHTQLGHRQQDAIPKCYNKMAAKNSTFAFTPTPSPIPGPPPLSFPPTRFQKERILTRGPLTQQFYSYPLLHPFQVPNPSPAQEAQTGQRKGKILLLATLCHIVWSVLSPWLDDIGAVPSKPGEYCDNGGGYTCLAHA